MDALLQKLADGPLADANKLFLPEGRRPAPRGPKPTYEGTALGDPVPVERVRKMKEDARAAEFGKILDYYATTTVPFERIAEHTKLDLEKVKAAMERRGRLA